MNGVMENLYKFIIEVSSNSKSQYDHYGIKLKLLTLTYRVARHYCIILEIDNYFQP